MDGDKGEEKDEKSVTSERNYVAHYSVQSPDRVVYHQQEQTEEDIKPILQTAAS